MNAKVKYKIYVIGLLSSILYVITTFAMFNITYYGYVNKSEESDVKKSFKIINYIVKDREKQMKVLMIDWAKWDDTYQFIEDLNKKYIASNLQGNTLENLSLNSMIFLNNNNEIVYEKNYRIKIDIIEVLKKEMLPQIINTSKSDSINVGLLFAKNKLFMVAIANVTKSDNNSMQNGHLIFVRAIENDLLKYIKQISGSKLIYKYFDKRNKNYSELNENIKIEKDKNNIKYNKLVKDINKRGTIMFEIVNEYNSDIRYYSKSFVLSFILLTIIVITSDYLIVNKYILKKISKLCEFANKVATTKDTELTIEMEGKDEFYELAVSINKMIKSLNSAYKERTEISERFMLTLEATNDGIFDFYVKSREVYITPHWKDMMGLGGLYGYDLYKKYISRIHHKCYSKVKDGFFRILDAKSEFFYDEYRLITNLGDIIWVLHRGRIVEKDGCGKPIRIISTLTNITDRKKYEEDIIFLSYSDKLTGLKNRAYMEKLFSDLDKEETSKYFIIMVDLNGLKATNDAFGYKEGNKLILCLSKILLESCDTDDFISRWGGDEFVILVKNKDESYISNLIVKIKNGCKNQAKLGFKISIALGYAEKNEETLDIETVMILAETRMCRNKLIENSSARSATINSLLETLHEKHSETEEHTIRIKILSNKLGKKLKLTNDKIDELELLSILHDIGKIGIPEHILMKPGKLTEEEWSIMKTHTNIGYRIVKSTPELAHVAEAILAHHERYDGTGYPNGLKGEEIPLLSRIINIVDSYDVMTHKRIYKDASDFAYALQELKRCSGTQFDPYIVGKFIEIIIEQ